MKTKEEMITVITKSQSESLGDTSASMGGCGRSYVCLGSKADRKTLNAFKAAFEACGIRYIGKAYGSGSRAAYIGYDNGNSYNIRLSQKIADNLNAIGVDCYSDSVGD